MSGPVHTGAKFIERFFCACGKEVKPVQMAKSKGTPSGMFWRCDGGHMERVYASKKTVIKG